MQPGTARRTPRRSLRPWSPTYTYDAANRLTWANEVEYTYDNRGNLTHDGVYTYTWDAAGRLVQAESITHTLVYTYNGDGVRVASAADGIETGYVQDVAAGCHRCWSRRPVGNDILPVRLSRLAQVQGTDAEWFLGDALGSVRQLADDDGGVVLARDYDPYGQMLSAERDRHQGVWVHRGAVGPSHAVPLLARSAVRTQDWAIP